MSRPGVFGSFIAALAAGGDSRLAIDPSTGLNKYLCPTIPTPALVCAASCTASPIASGGFQLAAEAFAKIVDASTEAGRQHRLSAHALRIETRLLRYFGATDLADAILCPSGTDALLTTARLLAAEQPGRPITAILPSASETGTGVPLAAACRVFDGPRKGTALIGWDTSIVEIPLRSDDGSPRSDDAVVADFSAAAARARGRPIVYLTHGTKTGLVAPNVPPSGVDVIVDACQGRVAPARVDEYLRLGWPVVVTGSKFFGGPAFSGAVLFPKARGPRARVAEDARGHDQKLGTVLRWTAALRTIETIQPVADVLANRLRDRGDMVRRAIKANPRVAPVGGLETKGKHWADQPSIFTFAVRDPSRPDRLLSESELRPLYVRFASAGLLFGQPVNLGAFGGLRLAIGARDLLDDPDGDGTRRLAEAVRHFQLER